jgi:aldose 1-epimerase
VPDKNGNLGDIVLVTTKLTDICKTPPTSAPSVGRYANRIANATFTLDGVKYTLAKNDGPNSLHGEPRVQQQRWDARIQERKKRRSCLTAY